MSEPHYGMETVMRPLLRNVPDRPAAGALESKCPYCGEPCWLMPMEQRFPWPIPPGFTYTAACTACALQRARRQRVMDRLRWERENAEVCEVASG